MENSNNPYTPPTSTTDKNILTPTERRALTIYLHFQGKQPTIWQIVKLHKKTIAAFFITIFVLSIGVAFLISASDVKKHSFFWGYMFGFLMACVIYYIIFNYQIIKQFCDFWKIIDKVLDFDKVKKLLNNEPVD